MQYVILSLYNSPAGVSAQIKYNSRITPAGVSAQIKYPFRIAPAEASADPLLVLIFIWPADIGYTLLELKRHVRSVTISGILDYMGCGYLAGREASFRPFLILLISHFLSLAYREASFRPFSLLFPHFSSLAHRAAFISTSYSLFLSFRNSRISIALFFISFI
jgi:hypothetical protein